MNMNKADLVRKALDIENDTALHFQDSLRNQYDVDPGQVFNETKVFTVNSNGYELLFPDSLTPPVPGSNVLTPAKSKITINVFNDQNLSIDGVYIRYASGDYPADTTSGVEVEAVQDGKPRTGYFTVNASFDATDIVQGSLIGGIPLYYRFWNVNPEGTLSAESITGTESPDA